MHKSYCCVGLMSGTSLDGLDIALCNLSIIDGKWSYSLLKTQTVPYSTTWHQQLKSAVSLSGYELICLHRKYGQWLGEQVKAFLEDVDVKVELICSHGHTVFHEPHKMVNFQIGDGAVIAGICGITTVSDFRSLDVCLGGQGAPLVPIGDQLLFSDYTACVNLGGFANLSCTKDIQRVAWDICAVNYVLNRLAGKVGKAFDEDGLLGQGGKVINNLLDELQSLDYYQKSHPKSLGQEWVDEALWPIIEKYLTAPVEDLCRTYYEHVAKIIADDLNDLDKGSVLFTGGGVFNGFLMERIKSSVQQQVVVGDEELVNYKEALIFALLGALRYEEQMNSLASVTGATRDSSSGIIHLI